MTRDDTAASVLQEIDGYAARVIAGAVPAGKYHRLACVRHRRNRARERAGDPDFPYRFDALRAKRLFDFAAKLRHYKGRQWAGKPIIFTESQRFRLGSIVGWVHRETGIRRFRTAYNELPRKQGKALAVDIPVPTPHGWMPHGNLRVGDFVFGPDGQPKRVEWVGPIERGPCFRLTVSTGESFVAHASHEWVTVRTWYTGRPKGSRQSLPPVETQHIAKTLRGGSRGDYIHRIPVCDSLVLPEATLPIPPYTFGAWLGGAWLGDGTSCSGSITVADDEIVRRIEQEGISCRAVYRKGAATLYRLDGHQGSQLSFTSRLRRAGVLDNKHIPIAYLRASHKQRLEVLRGIVDTDGSVDAKGIYEISSCSDRLATHIRELIHSLGLKSTLNVGLARIYGKNCGPRYRIQFSAHRDVVASIQRKQTSWCPNRRRRSQGRTITACDPCQAVPVNCIQVEGGLYVIGHDFIVTHNSLEAAVMIDYLTFFDGENGAESYCAATARDQAMIVFNDAKRLVKMSAGLRHRIGIHARTLYHTPSASKIQPLSADYDSMDGLNPHVVSLDEFHAMKNRGVVDALETALGARLQPLMFQITTAGDDPVSPCGDQHDYACKILEELLVDETFFAFIAHADPEDDPFDEGTWRKANPHWGISVNPADMRALATKARAMPAAAAAFKQKRLNIWTSASAPWLSMEGWKAGQSQWSSDDLLHQPCWVGVDLASSIDLCAMVFVFPPVGERKATRLLRWVWTPRDTIRDRARRDRAPYETWAEQDRLILVDGVRINHAVIRETLVAQQDRYRIEQIGFDPWHADQVMDDLIDEAGFDREQVVLVSQTYAGMSQAARDFEAAVLAGAVDAGGCPLMAWCASNVVVQRDGKDNIYPVKKRSRGRIDPIMATIIGWRLAMAGRTTRRRGKRGAAKAWTPGGWKEIGTNARPSA